MKIQFNTYAECLDFMLDFHKFTNLPISMSANQYVFPRVVWFFFG